VVVSRVGQSHDFVQFVRERWPRFKPAVIKKDAWIDYTEADNYEVPNAPCVRWWELNVTSDGKVRHCCMDDGHTDQWTIGDLNKQTMLEVYNQPFWRERREQLLSRKQLDSRSPCSRCTY
jgi:radical SAM protein with 4Fe4S-binding SPASM domain